MGRCIQMNLIWNWARQGLWWSSLSLSWALVARKLRSWLLYSKQPTYHLPIGSVNAKQGYGCSLKTEQNLRKISHKQWDKIKPGWLLDRKIWGKKLFTVLPTHNPTKPNTKYRERTEKWVTKPCHWSAQKWMSGMESRGIQHGLCLSKDGLLRTGATYIHGARYTTQGEHWWQIKQKLAALEEVPEASWHFASYFQ